MRTRELGPAVQLLRRPRGGRLFLFSSALRRERPCPVDDLPGNDNLPAPSPRPSPAAAIADRFRKLTVWLVLASSLIAVALTIALRVRVDPGGSEALEWLVAVLLLASRIWWARTGHQRIADACGTFALVGMAGMACGAFAMLELRLGFPVADGPLRDLDRAVGVDGIAVVGALVRQGHWLFAIMAPAYNYTVPLFFAGLVLLSFLRDRVEAWRAAFCFAGTLLTTCIVAIFVPAKGLGMWAPAELLDQLPAKAMRTFWPHFDEFYFGADPVLRLQVVDGVISFPSFHAVVGFLVLAMWRKNILTFSAAAVWLVFMLLATFPGGGHYFVDLAAGFAVWWAWFAWSRRIEWQVARGLLHGVPNSPTVGTAVEGGVPPIPS
jgi:membrane-associated phospholipid phosphatase